MKPIINLPAEHYLELIRQNKPFQLSRFGDGETISMQLAPHWLKENCDGSKFIPELIQPMRQIFRNQYDYYHCLLDCSFDLNGDHFRDFIEKTCPDMQFFNGEIWQHLSFSGRITELMEAIAPYEPCFVGGKHIENVKHMNGLGKIRFIEVPARDSYYKFEEIFVQVMNMQLAGCRMFLFSAGYTTKPLIDTLFPFIGQSTFCIDLGSVIDPFVGRLSRSGMVQAGKEKFQPFTKMKL